MSGHHDHGHHHHHSVPADAGGRLILALVITFGFVGVEIVAGLWANSLALLTDAAHNASDVLALLLSWIALWLTRRPAHARKTFGYHRAGILAAFVNSLTLVGIALGIGWEAIERLQNPLEVDAPIMIGVSLIAVLVNAGTAWLVYRGSENDLNLRSAFVHLMGDVLSTIGATIAGAIIFFTNWRWLDPLVSVLIAGFIIWHAWQILRDSIDVLLEATPRDIDVDKVVSDLQTIPGVQAIHDLHIWSITASMRALSAHVVTNQQDPQRSPQLINAINELLCHSYNIGHATLQLECSCNTTQLYCTLTEQHQH
ncbi:cation diffusion facilitator family transporter [Herpetosiphon giganteus]|uniref:cation diffusion facilitator family transporter n=1 Tax=Herpetosiphon giganteus TaxID=2029754 RepID=UPI00195972F4|nr:cation diffusion facilitator family transporter [Herpetosiphon giganteus]MBM7843296.1 cobalt-zinc-cadmium efflux system protein [Herpetosiphon giganteus]